KIGQAAAQRLHRLAPARVRGHLIAVPLERFRVVGADGGVILDDHDAAGHAATIPEALLPLFRHLSSSPCQNASPGTSYSPLVMAPSNKEIDHDQDRILRNRTRRPD